MTVMTATRLGSVEPVTATMPEALASTWTAIRKRHRGVPVATVQVAPGRGSGCQAVSWDSDNPVILVGPQTVMEGPREILGYLLHQAAHGLQETGSGAPGKPQRYHNSHYRDEAQKLGLSVDWTKHGIGFSATSVPDHTADVYAQAIAQLARALESWQEPRRARVESYNGVTARCGCPRTIRLRSQHGAEELAEQPIVCTVCGKQFMPDAASGTVRRLAAKVDEHPTEYARGAARARSGNRSARP
jgi:hypothetical protein